MNQNAVDILLTMRDQIIELSEDIIPQAQTVINLMLNQIEIFPLNDKNRKRLVTFCKRMESAILREYQMRYNDIIDGRTDYFFFLPEPANKIALFLDAVDNGDDDANTVLLNTSNHLTRLSSFFTIFDKKSLRLVRYLKAIQHNNPQWTVINSLIQNWLTVVRMMSTLEHKVTSFLNMVRNVVPVPFRSGGIGANFVELVHNIL